MAGWKDTVTQFSPLLIVSLAAAGWVTFLLIAEASGFKINVLLFALPLVASLAVLTLSKIKLKHGPMTGSYCLTLIVVVVLVSAILRLFVAFHASYYPDEYDTWSIFKMNPWGNISEFMHNYQEVAGRQGVHPPLGFLLMSLGYGILHSLEGARLVSVFAGLLSIPVVYWLISIVIDRPTALYATLIFSLLPQTVIFLSLALTDAYVFLFGLLSLTTFVFAIKNRRRNYLLASGIFLGLAFWSKEAIPILWAFAIFLSALFSGWIPRIQSLARAFYCFLIGGVIYGLWYVFSPISFRFSTEFLFRILWLKQFNVGSFVILPSIANAQQGSISFFDLLLQLPAWFTPLILVTGILGVYISLRTRDRQTFWIVLWAIVPLLGSVVYYRDIRYLLISSVPIATLALIGIRPASRRKIVLSTLLVFLVVGSISFIPIVQQQYAGIREASEVLNSLGLSNQVILTNAIPIKFYLPYAKLIYLSPLNSTKSVHDLLNGERVGAAVVLHQRRGAWGGTLAPDVMELIQGYFNHRIVDGLPSDFSWYEVLYSSPSGNAAADLPDLSVTGAHTPNLHFQLAGHASSTKSTSYVSDLVSRTRRIRE